MYTCKSQGSRCIKPFPSQGCLGNVVNRTSPLFRYLVHCLSVCDGVSLANPFRSYSSAVPRLGNAQVVQNGYTWLTSFPDDRLEYFFAFMLALGI